MARTRSERAHHDVVEAAAAVLGRVGVAGFTIDEVVTRSGVAKSTIYRWWPNRQALLLDVAHSLLTPAATPNSGNTRDDLIAYLSSFATYPATRRRAACCRSCAPSPSATARSPSCVTR